MTPVHTLFTTNLQSGPQPDSDLAMAVAILENQGIFIEYYHYAPLESWTASMKTVIDKHAYE
jgi:hypothetical protein